MFLKQKRCGRIEGRGCANGRKQKLYKTKEKTSSPTIHTESLFLSCMIDALENRNVVTLDIPGAFMQADIDELIHVKLVGELADLLIKVGHLVQVPQPGSLPSPILFTEFFFERFDQL